jgi:tRNA U34 2-thiouridine synthase MnmA/TrmU
MCKIYITKSEATMAKAVALYSGGLDSTLAILVIMRQGIEVTALTFLNHFGCDISDKSSCSKDPFSASEQFGFAVKLSHLSEQFLDIVKNPKHGHGKNMNPCIDCRILMLREARKFMDITKADFLITGEVLGQRPMSQRKSLFPMIDKAATIRGYVLRPLSAQLLEPTIPEQKGIVNREALYDFSGRSRKPQMALAREFGLTDYPSPAGGCLLTDPNYSYRLRELLTYTKDPGFKDINLLRIGRHFRFSPECKIIVGRNHEENILVKSLAGTDDYLLKVEGYGSPLTLVTGNADEESLKVASSLCARYSDAKHLSEITVAVYRNMQATNRTFFSIKPARDEVLEIYRIEQKTIMIPSKKPNFSFL